MFTRTAREGSQGQVWGWLLAFCLLGSAPAGAVLSELPLQHWGAEDGLSHNSVYAVLQDRRGFIWIGTADGLNRFDGYAFVTFRPDATNAASLPNSIVHALLEDRRGNLWIGTHGGLAQLSPDRAAFRRYPLVRPRSAAALVIWALYEDRRGRLWAATDSGLFRYQLASDRFVPVSLPYTDALFLAEHPDGTVWALGSTREGSEGRLRSGLVPVATGSSGREPAPWSLAFPAGGVTAFGIDRGGRFWVSPRGPLEAVGDLLRDPIREGTNAFLETRNGELWMGTTTGFCRGGAAAPRLECRPLRPGGTWLDNYVRCFAQERSGAVWIGSYTGIYRLDPAARPFRALRFREEGAPQVRDAVSAFWQEPGGAVWMGTFGGGLLRLDPASEEVRRFRHGTGPLAGLPGEVIWALQGEADAEGRVRLWIATDRGLCRFEPRSGLCASRALPIPEGQQSGLPLAAMAWGADGKLWLGGPSGLYRFDPATGACRRFVPPVQSSQLERSVESILLDPADPDGALWLGSGYLGLRRFEARTGTFIQFRLQTAGPRPLASEGIWDLERAPDGVLWLGTNEGLVRFDPRTRAVEALGVEAGLPGSVVYSVLLDAKDRLWLGTNRGLARLDLQTRKVRSYDLADGIGSMEFNRGAALRAQSGEFLFGGVSGVTAFRPEAVADDSQPPAVVLTRLEIESERGLEPRALNPLAIDRLLLRPGDSAFTVEFAALSYANPGKNQYAFELEGLDSSWVAAAGRRFARYSAVPPGDYVLRVKAANADGVWNERGIALPVTVLPPYWKTGWFRLCLAAIVAGILWAAYRWRLRQQIAVERLRLRIASDLHDDLSSELSGIALAADSLRQRPGLGARERGELSEIRERSLQAVSLVRDTVWSVNPEYDSVADLVRRLRSTASALLGDAVAVEASAAAIQARLAMAERRALFLISKELLHNAARHARARAVHLEIGLEGAALVLRVRDDGVGFDPQAPAAGEGLRSLRRRAAQIHADLTLESRPGAGTEAVLRVPL